VAAFGAFVDVGVHQDGLVHISAMSHTYVKDPRKIAKPGDVIRVKVLEVDPKRRRISGLENARSLTAVDLGPGPIARLLPAFAPGGIGECRDLNGGRSSP
jgi:exosome complex RNA-binding protein Rrp4